MEYSKIQEAAKQSVGIHWNLKTEDEKSAFEMGFKTGAVWLEAEEEHSIDWEQRRYEIARGAMIFSSAVVDIVDPRDQMQRTAKHCIALADALIEELKKTSK